MKSSVWTISTLLTYCYKLEEDTCVNFMDCVSSFPWVLPMRHVSTYEITIIIVTRRCFLNYEWILKNNSPKNRIRLGIIFEIFLSRWTRKNWRKIYCSIKNLESESCSMEIKFTYIYLYSFQSIFFELYRYISLLRIITDRTIGIGTYF